MAWQALLRIWPLSYYPPPQAPILVPAPPPTVAVSHRHAFIAHPSLPNSFSHPAAAPQILFNDVLVPVGDHGARTEDYTAAGLHPATLRTRLRKGQKPRLSSAEYQSSRRMAVMQRRDMVDLDWDEVEIAMPDVEDRPTLVELAKITGDACRCTKPNHRNPFSLMQMRSRARNPGMRWTESGIQSVASAQIPSRLLFMLSSPSHLVGKMTQMDFVATYSCLQIIRQWSSPSKAPHYLDKALQPRMTSSTTTSYFLAVARVSIILGRGTPSVIAVRGASSVKTSAWSQAYWMTTCSTTSRWSVYILLEVAIAELTICLRTCTTMSHTCIQTVKSGWLVTLWAVRLPPCWVLRSVLQPLPLKHPENASLRNDSISLSLLRSLVPHPRNHIRCTQLHTYIILQIRSLSACALVLDRYAPRVAMLSRPVVISERPSSTIQSDDWAGVRI